MSERPLNCVPNLLTARMSSTSFHHVSHQCHGSVASFLGAFSPYLHHTYGRLRFIWIPSRV
jgi:hypothetical protein